MKLILWILAVIFALGVSGWLAFETQTEFSIIVIPVMAITVVCFMIWMATNLKKSTEEKEQNRLQEEQEQPISTKKQKEDILSGHFFIPVRGGSYRSIEAKEYIKTMKEDTVLYLHPEPTNAFDKNAVMVITTTGIHLGYIAKEYALVISDLLRNSINIIAKSSFQPINQDRYLFWISICLSDKSDLETDAFEKAELAKQEEHRIKDLRNVQNTNNIWENIELAEKSYDCGDYVNAENLMLPFIKSGIQDSYCCNILVMIYHIQKRYEEELEILNIWEKSTDIFKAKDDTNYIKRRKYAVLRILGIISSNTEIQNDKENIYTTIEELDAYNLVTDILSTSIDVNRIDYRDTQKYFSILLDDNNRKPICRLYLNGTKKYIGTFDNNKNEFKTTIGKLSDISNYKNCFIQTIKYYE